MDINNITDKEIKTLMDRYTREKEYRRLYYAKKYNTDPKYRAYIREYNKVRYENKVYAKNVSQGMDNDKALSHRALKIQQYFKKNNNEEEFINKYPQENKLYNLLISNNITLKLGNNSTDI